MYIGSTHGDAPGREPEWPTRAGNWPWVLLWLVWPFSGSYDRGPWSIESHAPALRWPVCLGQLGGELEQPRHDTKGPRRANGPGARASRRQARCGWATAGGTPTPLCASPNGPADPDRDPDAAFSMARCGIRSLVGPAASGVARHRRWPWRIWALGLLPYTWGRRRHGPVGPGHGHVGNVGD